MQLFSGSLHNSTAIVGENGVGKTCILEIISSAYNSDLRKFGSNSWFALYKNNRNEYFIEGENIKVVEPLNQSINEYLQRFSYQCSIDKNTGKILAQKYLQDSKSYKNISYLKLQPTNLNKYTYHKDDLYGIYFSRYTGDSSSLTNKYILLHEKKIKDVFNLEISQNLMITINESFRKNESVLNNETHSVDTKNSDLLQTMESLSKNLFFTRDGVNYSIKDCQPSLNPKAAFKILLYESLFYEYIKHAIYSEDITQIKKVSKIAEKTLTFLSTYDQEYLSSSTLKQSIIFLLTAEKLLIYETHLTETIVELYNLLHDDVISFIDGSHNKNYDFKIEEIFKALAEINDNYFSYDKYYKKPFIISEFDNNKQIINLLNFIDKLNFMYSRLGFNVFDCSFGNLSSGQNDLVSYYSSLHTKLSKLTNQTVIIIIDEYEQHLHPEWARVFFHYLIKFLNSYTGKKLKFQIIMTTHSPYLVSDLPKENIIMLKKHRDGRSTIISNPSCSFASNYYDLINDAFFLKDTIGEFARNKIGNIIKMINKINKNSTSNYLENIENNIDIIDNEFIKNTLNNKLHSRTLAVLNDRVKINQQIDRLQKKIDALQQINQK